MTNLKVVVIDDEVSILKSLAAVLKDEGCEVNTFSSGIDASRNIEKINPDLIFLDIWMDDRNGLDVLQDLNSLVPKAEVVIISGHATIEVAVKATKLGAAEFIEKPLSIDQIIPLLERVRVIRSNSSNKTSVPSSQNSPVVSIIGSSKKTRFLKMQLERVAPQDVSVLIYGENGTGKEVLAQSLHQRSGRKSQPFVAVNCAAIPEDQIENEFFGSQENGHQGKFQAAHKGTLFLDEVGDLSLRAQSKILRILDSGELAQVGQSIPGTVDVRLIASTNKNLKNLIAAGLFREDLYYRLNVVPIRIAPLRERLEDFVDFIKYFQEQNDRKLHFSDGAMQAIVAYSWPGNVRELKHFIKRISILHESSVVEERDIQEYLEPAEAGSDGAEPGASLFEVEWKDAKTRFEIDFLTKKLEEAGWNVSKTAERIGVERSNLHRRIKSLGIRFPAKSGD